jgi:ABC-type branched-subunit amino acid transport system ATPase component
VGLLLGVPSLRLSGPYLAMATMAFNLIVQRLLVNWVELTGGPDGLPGLPGAAIGPLMFDRRTSVYLVAGVVLAGLVAARNLVGSSYGRALVAVREDELAAASLGVDLHRTKLLAFGLSAVYAGLAGSLFAHLYRHISPISFGLEASLELLLAVILGGQGTLVWPLVGAAIVTVLPQLPALQSLQELRLLVYGGLLLAAVVLFRGGLGRREGGMAGQTDSETERRRAREAIPPSLRPSVPPSLRLSLRPSVPPSPLLRLERLSVRYGRVAAVTELDLEVGDGEIVAVLGANGAGKSTVLRAVSGLATESGGRVVFDGRELHGVAADRRAGLGVAHVPEGRLVFADQSVEDNLRLGAYRRHFRAERQHIGGEVERMLHRFPALGERRRVPAGKLSGGEQQQLAIARALMARPRLLLLDEPSLGLAPRLVQQVFELVAELRAEGMSILLVEQLAYRALELADRAYVLRAGRCVLSGTGQQVAQDARLEQAYLGVARSGS